MSTRSQPPSSAVTSPRINVTSQSPPAGTSSNTPYLTQEDLEEPPAYTPRPDAHVGETTVEIGPSRPFQPAPTQPRTPSSTWGQIQNQLGPTSPPPQQGQRSTGRLRSLINQITGEIMTEVNMAMNSATASRAGLSPQPTGSQWNSYPGQQSRLTSTQPQQPFYAPQSPPQLPPRSSLLPPPPRHPSSSTSLTSLTPGPPLPPRRRHSSEFARDFYAAGPLEAISTPDVSGSGSGLGVSESGIRHTRSVSESRAGSSRGGAGEDGAGDDGRPTTVPTPGHPLLNNGRLLVYPKGFECHKCHNTGYKSNDPLNPCKKCWNKHAKSFSGPLAYASFSGADVTGNFQRPLPAQGQQGPSHRRSRGTLTKNARPPSGIGMTSQPTGSGGVATHNQSHSPSYFSPPSNPANAPYPPGVSYPTRNGAPPGAVVYTSGDPRLGGRICWQCGGRGSVSLLFFDRETCGGCGGIGRVFD